MNVIIIDSSETQHEVTVPDDTVATLKNLCASAFNISSGIIQLTYAGDIIDATLPLSAQIASGATLYLQKRRFHLSDVKPDVSPDALLTLCAEHDNLLPQILSADPELGESLTTRDAGKVRMLMMKRAMKQHKSIFQRDQELKKIWDNPDDLDNQKKIAEMIQQEEIEKAHAMAMEENPESFAQVYMLYIKLEVNGIPLKAFVDSGAQMTIMSPSCAERCGILRLMDKRYAGMASGVGTARILGKIHMVQMKLGNSFFPVSVTILENASMDVLFGLDTLKRYRCCIDLNKGCLRMEDSANGCPEEVRFLSEGEIPKSEKDAGDGDGDGSGFLGGGPSLIDAAAGGASSSTGEKMDATSDASGTSNGNDNGDDRMDIANDAPPSLQRVKSLDEKLAGLVALGFTESQCRGALDACNGDAEAAANLLFASS